VISPISFAALLLVTTWSAPSPNPVELEVETKQAKDFRDHAKLVRDNVEFRAKEKLGDASTQRPARVRVVVTVTTVGRYQLEVTTELDGKPLSDAVVTDACEQCLMDDLLARVDPAIERQMEALRAAEQEATPADDTPVPPATDGGPAPHDDPGPAPPVDEPRRVPLLGLGKAGIGLLATGAVGLGVGIGLAVAGRRLDRDDERGGTDFRPAGYATLGVSAALLVTGAVLLGVDRGRARRLRNAAAPLFGPRFAGIVVVGRF